MERDELQDMLDFRVEYYNLLRHLYFLGPQQRILQSLVELVQNLDLDCADEDTLSGTKLLGSLASRNIENGAELEKIQLEFARVFFGPSAPSAPLYESHYRAPDSLLMQETTIAKRRYYLDAGLISGGKNQIPEDHLSVELEYLYYLACEAKRLWSNGDDDATIAALQESRDFLQQCSAWICDMVDRAVAATEMPAISGMALLTRGFLKEDLAFLAELCE